MYNDYGSGAAIAAIFATLLVGLLFAAAFYVIASIFLMKIFEKAGVQGKWRAWVPVYNMMVFAKLGDISPWVVLILAGASLIPYLNFLTGLALSVVLILAAWRVGLKLQKDAVWIVLYIFLSLVWYGINAFDKSRWNPQIVPAPWAGNSFFSDSTVWEGIPVQPTAPAQGYAPPQGYTPPQGYAPPAPQGYAPPAAPGYTPPAAPAAPSAAPGVPPVPPTTPPAPPVTPPAPPAPPVPPTDPTQPPA